MRTRCVLILFLTVIFLPSVAASNAPEVTLVSPANGNVSISNNITFICNVTDDENVFNVSLYHNINGSFRLNSTKNIMELEKDSNTTLLCHFDETYTCEDGEQGINTSTHFATSKFMQGAVIDDSDSLRYLTENNMVLSQGTVEFWFQVGLDPSSNSFRLFSTSLGGSSGNYIDAYIESDILYFSVHGENEEYSRAYGEFIPTWEVGEWHHVAGIWDVNNGVGSDEVVDLFLDGSNSSVSYDGGLSQAGEIGAYMYIGSDQSMQSKANAIFDELRISSWPRSPEEINASYLKGAGNHSSETVEWNLTGIPDGSYLWNCLAYDNNSQSNWAASNSTFHIDTYSPPDVTSIILSPNSTNDQDPGVTINVTANITDPSNVSFVVFQWKETGEWNNDTMDYNNATGLYENASMTIDLQAAGWIYYYRIWSNDTLGHSGYSLTYNITVDWDYTWARNPSSLGTAYGFIDCSNCYVGTIIINNTGDANLSFTLSDNQPFIDINYNVSNPFSLGPKNVMHINVTADFRVEESKYDVTINITAFHGSKIPSPVSQTVTATLIPQSGGPWFDSDDIIIFNYPESVYHGMSYNFSARLENIGNESATGVWMNWTLPTGWINTSGNLSGYIGELNGTASGGNIAWNNITVYISPTSATAGIRNVSINVNSSENLNDSDSKTVYVICNNNDDVCGAGCSYVTDSDCSVPQTPGGGGTTITSIGGIAKEYKIELAAPARIDVNRGETQVVRIGVRNNVSGTKLKNVYLSLSGYQQTFLNSSPAYIDEIGYGETGYFDIGVKAPSYATYNEYYLNLTVSGRFSEGNKTTGAEKNATILLVTHKFIGNDMIAYSAMAEAALREMSGAGFETSQISGIIGEINKSMEEGNYDNVKELSEKAIGIRDSALKLNTQIQETETSIESIRSQSFGLPQSEKMLSLAKSAFLRGDYQKAEERLSSTMLIFAVESGNVGTWIFMARYWWALAPAILLSGTGIVAARRRLARTSLKKKLDLLMDEERVVQEMIENLQKEHFVDRKIGTDSYERSMKNYENGLDMIRRKRADVLLILSKKLKSRDAVKKLDGEEKRLKDLIIDAQKKYFERGKIGKLHYEKTMGGLRWELLEVQRIREALEGGKHV